jgi:hypothetical protein
VEISDNDNVVEWIEWDNENESNDINEEDGEDNKKGDNDGKLIEYG